MSNPLGINQYTKGRSGRKRALSKAFRPGVKVQSIGGRFGSSALSKKADEFGNRGRGAGVSRRTGRSRTRTKASRARQAEMLQQSRAHVKAYRASPGARGAATRARNSGRKVHTLSIESKRHSQKPRRGRNGQR